MDFSGLGKDFQEQVRQLAEKSFQATQVPQERNLGKSLPVPEIEPGAGISAAASAAAATSLKTPEKSEPAAAAKEGVLNTSRGQLLTDDPGFQKLNGIDGLQKTMEDASKAFKGGASYNVPEDQKSSSKRYDVMEQTAAKLAEVMQPNGAVR